RIASACKICVPNTSMRVGPHNIGPVTANATNAPRCRSDRAGATESIYRLSKVSASQLGLAKGTIVNERTANPIPASGTVMNSSSLRRYSNPNAAKQANQTTALTPNKFSTGSNQPAATIGFTT